jgi:hypothetical protein
MLLQSDVLAVQLFIGAAALTAFSVAMMHAGLTDVRACGAALHNLRWVVVFRDPNTTARSWLSFTNSAKIGCGRGFYCSEAGTNQDEKKVHIYGAVFVKI